MRDRWDEEDELRRDRLREPEPTLADHIDAAIRKVVTGVVIAGGLIALALFSRGGTRVEAPEYQITAAADGRVYRVNTESGTVVTCQGTNCQIILRGSRGLVDLTDDEEDGDETPKQNAVAAPPPAAQLPAPAAQAPAPAPAQVAPPQNAVAPAPR